MFQHTAARRRLGAVVVINDCAVGVSTHSRPKAAGPFEATTCPFVTFQHTAARRRLAYVDELFQDLPEVSTHSRPKAAGYAREQAHDGQK